ncbi:hypothetical protein NDI44_21030 [Trichocoleus sp. DQ-A3]|uniref:VIT domain-containing protein n=1 Tax=Coleofasciculus sp. FACHB-125 TaxID=2692784 RepID=UPI001682A282|nr:hypothetical protein [Coleofasciculus sp. FACHB-125]
MEVTQGFKNSFPTTLKVVYIFPLSDEAPVDDMLIRISDRARKKDNHPERRSSLS